MFPCVVAIGIVLLKLLYIRQTINNIQSWQFISQVGIVFVYKVNINFFWLRH